MTTEDEIAHLRRIFASDHRAAAHVSRDSYRHPVETLTFFRVRPDETIVEIWPGSTGYYTEILAPFVRNRGCYIAAGYDPETEESFDATPYQAQFEAVLDARPDLYDH